MADEGLTWTADGLDARLPVRDPFPTLKVALFAGLAVAIGLVGYASMIPSGPTAMVSRPPVPQGCVEAPWSCPVGPDGTPANGGTWHPGLDPDGMYRAAYAVAAGLADPGPGARPDCVGFLRNPGTSAHFDTLDRCVLHLEGQAVAGRLTVPESVPNSGSRPIKVATFWSQNHRERLLNRWRAETARVTEDLERVAQDRAELATKAEQRRVTLLSLAGFLLVGLVLALLTRRHALRPLRLQLTPVGLRIDNRVFPRRRISSARLGDTLMLRLTDGQVFESRPLALGVRDDLRAALAELLLSDEELLAEHTAQPEVEGALDPLRKP